MTDRISITFRVRDKGGPSGGKTISREVPNFDFDRFLATPNAPEFVRKAYFAALKKIIREIEETKNGSVPSDLGSFESIIARSLTFTKDEIADWAKTRDWQRASQVTDMGKLLPMVLKTLPSLATRRHPFSEDVANTLAYKVIAAVADNPDPIGDFLFTILTTTRAEDTDHFLL